MDKKINFYICPYYNKETASSFHLRQDPRINYIDWRYEDCEFYDGWELDENFSNKHHWTTKSAYEFLKRIAKNEGFDLYDQFNIKKLIVENIPLKYINL